MIKAYLLVGDYPPANKHGRGKSEDFYVGNTLPETNSSHLKMDGWNTFSFPFGIAYVQVKLRIHHHSPVLRQPSPPCSNCCGSSSHGRFFWTKMDDQSETLLLPCFLHLKALMVKGAYSFCPSISLSLGTGTAHHLQN